MYIDMFQTIAQEVSSDGTESTTSDLDTYIYIYICICIYR